MSQPLIIVSACLLGTRCKYNGGDNRCAALCRALDPDQLLPVCPEVAGGLPIPRTPAERRGDRVVTRTGLDVTDAFIRGVSATLETIGDRPVICAILQPRSPSCGVCQHYDGTFTGRLVSGPGLFAEALMARGIPVYEPDTWLAQHKDNR